MHALHPAAAIRFGWTLVCDTCFPCWLEAVNRILTLRALGGSACCRCGTVRMCVAKANPLLFRLWAGRVALAVARCEFCVVDASPRRALGGSGRSCCGAARILRSRSEPSPGFARVEPLLLWHGAKSAWSMALVGSGRSRCGAVVESPLLWCGASEGLLPWPLGWVLQVCRGRSRCGVVQIFRGRSKLCVGSLSLWHGANLRTLRTLGRLGPSW